MVGNFGNRKESWANWQKFTWKILEIPTRRKLGKSSISRIFQPLPLPYSDRQNLPTDRIFQWAEAAPGEKVDMERIVRRSYGHKNGPRNAEKISKGKTHEQKKSPVQAVYRAKKSKEKAACKIRRLKVTISENTNATEEHHQPNDTGDTGQR